MSRVVPAAARSDHAVRTGGTGVKAEFFKGRRTMDSVTGVIDESVGVMVQVREALPVLNRLREVLPALAKLQEIKPLLAELHEAIPLLAEIRACSRARRRSASGTASRRSGS